MYTYAGSIQYDGTYAYIAMSGDINSNDYRPKLVKYDTTNGNREWEYT